MKIEEIYKHLDKHVNNKCFLNPSRLCRILNHCVSSKLIGTVPLYNRFLDCSTTKRNDVKYFTLTSDKNDNMELKNIFHFAKVSTLNDLKALPNWYGKICINITSATGSIEDMIDYIKHKKYVIAKITISFANSKIPELVKKILDFAISTDYTNKVFDDFNNITNNDKVLNKVINEYHCNGEIDKLQSLCDRFGTVRILWSTLTNLHDLAYNK